MKDIGRKGAHYFKREAWTFMPQWNLPEKVFVIERLRKVMVEGKIAHGRAFRTGEVEYRVGYYMVGKIGRMHEKWTWGQYCALIPAKDFNKFFEKARREKNDTVRCSAMKKTLNKNPAKRGVFVLINSVLTGNR